ncbi:MAG: DEAD/DEAH box helicase family protein [Actinomycetota bacterium]|nr:DEAD/DEAH box helicase family protein [Actinomycetota bacterium]MDA8357556.1 DEAD/DEAH box helicase family protein [Actinomycetota bacterium]
MLRDLDLQPYYRSDRHRLLRDFYEPCLATASRYDRAVGYFTSATLAAAARGLRPFIDREGRMRLVASPHLSDDDVEAIRSGYEARDDVLQRALLRELTGAEVPDPIRQRLEFLAWLIGVERLEVKIAIVSGHGQLGIYHEKVGIFFDERGDSVVFSGSANESVGGLLANFEALEVFRSWLPEDAGRAERWVVDFEHLWTNRTAGLEVHDFPEAVRHELLERYWPTARPRHDPEEEAADPAELVREGRAAFGQPTLPPAIELRDYQKLAVQRWFAAGGRGIWEMATGAGKTFAALAAVAQVYRRLTDNDRSLAVVVVCPFQHLVEQWAEAAATFGIRAIRCSGSRDSWMTTLADAFAGTAANEIPFVLAAATNQTFAGDAFQAHLLPYRGDLLIIGDEVHNLGAPTLREALPEHAAYRLGLSATPERHFDPEGSAELAGYFGPTVFSFSLADAIDAGALVRYRYFPVLVPLSDDEQEQYLALSERIARLAATAGGSLDAGEVPGPLQIALFERARLLGAASGKVPALRALMEPLKDSSHNLVYCADSESRPGQQPQLEQVLSLLGRDLQMRVNSYTHLTTPAEREERRRRFAEGDLQALVAIRCLDEGVDIPEARRGFILASTTNPRQFVQRRGRLLRRAPGKERADLYDFIVVPPEVSSTDRKLWETERRLVGRELARVVELADAAANGPEALGQLLDLRRRYDLMAVEASTRAGEEGR